VPLNVAYAFTALTFVMVFAASAVVLREPFSFSTYLGLTLVLAGFLVLAVGSPA
jgi:multidrug transporter EmrE-like cation transporter